MYYYVIRYVLLNQVEKTGIIDDIGGFTLDALVYLPSYMGTTFFRFFWFLIHIRICGDKFVTV